MNLRRIFLLTIGLLCAMDRAHGDDGLQPLQQLGSQALTAFYNHSDGEARQLFQQFLDRVNSSESALRDTQIEFVIGMLGCAIGDREMGLEALDYLLEVGKGITQNRGMLQQVRNVCAGSGPVVLPASALVDSASASVSAGPGVSGKGGAFFSRPVASLTLEKVTMADLEKRMEDTADPATALAPTLARFGGGHGTVNEHFIVVTDGTQSWAEGVASCLERYRAVLSRDFDMTTPAHLITVYNSQWADRPYREAPHLHGLELPPGTIAYSVYADLSMAGEGAPNKCGSLAHELVHLMIKDNFADAPAWLEEGLASAVALSIPEGNHLSFLSGWRDDTLRAGWQTRPSVEQLLSLTWDDFLPHDQASIRQVAVVQAMASVFARYLASRNKLNKVYFAVRKQDLHAELLDHHTRKQVVERELGKSLAEVDSDFAAWFKKPSGQTKAKASSKPCATGPPAHPQQQTMPCEAGAK